MNDANFQAPGHKENIATAIAPAPLDLCDGRLFALSNPIELNARLAWYPPTVRGFAPVNAYLLIEGTHALMVDTGVTIHRDVIIEQLRMCLPGKALSLAFTRIGEYPAICNATTIAERVPVEAIYAMFPDALSWLEFRPRAARRNDRSWAIGRAPDCHIATRGEGVPVGSGQRRLHVMPTPIRLLPSQWFYDDGTRTLFTGNAFSHGWRRSPIASWLVDDLAEGIDPSSVRDHLLARYWWMAGALGLAEIQRGLAAVFETYDIETIAPGYGCIIHGRSEVERHYELLQAAIGGLVRS